MQRETENTIFMGSHTIAGGKNIFSLRNKVNVDASSMAQLHLNSACQFHIVKVKYQISLTLLADAIMHNCITIVCSILIEA